METKEEELKEEIENKGDLINRKRNENIKRLIEQAEIKGIEEGTTEAIKELKKKIDGKLFYLKNYRGTFKRGNFRQMLEELKQNIKEK